MTIATKPTDKEWHVPVSAAAGGNAGGYICFIFEGVKKKLQSGQQISWHPRELYRGSTSFAVSVTTATVASMTVRHIFQNMPNYDHSSKSWEAASAIGGGMVGAIFGSTPVENIILTQQLNKAGPLQAINILVKQGIARPFVGLPELMMREAGFAGVMLWGGKAAKEYVHNQTQNPALANTAEIGTSLVGATFTQPFDTLATAKQKSDGKLSSRQVIQAIYQKDGAKGFFRGLSGRAFLFTGCAMIIPRMEQIVHNFLRNHS